MGMLMMRMLLNLAQYKRFSFKVTGDGSHPP
jgi:hypothetical protein